MRKPSVLTVILNYRTADMTVRAAQAALAAMQGIPGDVLIVDNDSRDGSFERLTDAARTMDRVRVVQAGWNGGFGAGNNVGIRAGLADGSVPDYVYLLNSDALPDPDALQRLVDFMQGEARAGMAGSHVRGPDGVPHTTLFRFPSVAGEFEGAARTGIFSRLLRGSVVPLPIPDRPVMPDWVAGASVLMRRRMLDEIGLFDETFFLYFEETDLCRRAARAGWRVHYVPQSRVVHVGSVSTGMKEWVRTPDYWYASHRHYFVKNHGVSGYVGAVAARLAGGAIWRLRVVLTGKPRIDPPGHLRGFLTHALRSAPARPTVQRPATLSVPKESK